MVKWFEDLVKETLTDKDLKQSEIEQIEDTVRSVIFHSTLDWQTKRQLKKAIREAYQISLMV